MLEHPPRRARRRPAGAPAAERRRQAIAAGRLDETEARTAIIKAGIPAMSVDRAAELVERTVDEAIGAGKQAHAAMGSAPAFEQAKSAPAEAQNFTNCGKPERNQIIVKSTKKLTRVPFTVSRLMEFCNRRELVNQTGHDVWEWALVVLKELTDNALDEAEEAGIAPVIEVEVDGTRIIISDNGRGIPTKTIESVLDYSIRVSSREAYVSPTRGAQGNALKTILPMGYVLNEKLGEEASGETVIEAYGIAHHIVFEVDHVRQEPKLSRITKPSPVVRGSKITVDLPRWSGYAGGIIEHAKDRFLSLAESYAWLNPHLTIRVVWNGELKIDIKASNPTWNKWLPSWPTSPHWYDRSRFRRYMAAHIANREDITVREFISEFDGMSSTAKQKAVLLETGASHVLLGDYFGRHKANIENIAKLQASLQKRTRPIRPARLGIIGKEHFYRLMEAAGGNLKTFTYNRSLGETGGVPRVVEFAFGIHRDGLNAARGPGRKLITGVNWSPGINNPFRQIGRSGDGLDAILAEVRANTSQPVIAVLHLACPRVAYTDRGKSAIVVEGDPEVNDDE
jgi:hypothetical protein